MDRAAYGGSDARIVRVKNLPVPFRMTYIVIVYTYRVRVCIINTINNNVGGKSVRVVSAVVFAYNMHRIFMLSLDILFS